MSDDSKKAKTNQKTGQHKQHDDVQGGGVGGGKPKHADGTQSEHSKNERTGSQSGGGN
ncbi:MAG TPA: hypothetical protein VGB53_05465 [Rubricoccaceae bacterium]|jgi:hypothetical protein